MPTPISLRIQKPLVENSTILLRAKVRPGAEWVAISLMYNAPEWHEYSMTLITCP